ncbi:hypothetical protein [Brevibacillus porteri]|uniref:hypothetical protein n=1 Tax=Brevibacillus porteri TaxID=2126350 RepID=UPI0036305BCC
MNEFTGFNLDKQSCRTCIHNVETININLKEPEDIVYEFFSKIKFVKSEEDLHTRLLEFYDAVADNEIKHYISKDINSKLGDLYEFDHGILDVEGDLTCSVGCCNCK